MNTPTRVLTSIVEGHGEVAALPLLLRRIAQERAHFPVVEKPHRLARTDFAADAMKRAYRLQRLRAGSDGLVVILCDADDDRAEGLMSVISEAVGHDPAAVIAVAVREYEAWFLAALSSLNTHRAVRADATFDGDPEGPRNAKKPLEEAMTESYKETIHQPAFSNLLDLETARRRSPSFARFCDDLWTRLEDRP